MFKVPEQFRITEGIGPMCSSSSDGNNGVFKIDNLAAIASDYWGWEHVSVSTENRCPQWNEMKIIKDLFWGEEDCVIQFHPPKSQYVNCHTSTLHMWRQIGVETALPPSFMVGPK